MPRTLLLLALLVLAGCASLPWNQSAQVEQKRQQRHTAAMREFDRQRDQAQYKAAAQRMRQGDWQDSREMLESLIDRSPDHRDARLLLLEVSMLAEDRQRAAYHARQAAERHPDDAGARHAAGLVLELLGHTDEALVHFDRARQLDAANPIYRDSHDHLSGQLGGAEGETLHQAVPTQASWQEQGKGKENNGFPVRQTSQVASPDSSSPSDRCGVLADAVQALDANRFEQAILILTHALTICDESPELHRTLALAYYRQGDYSAAVETLRHALFLDKSNGLTYFLMGAALDKLGEHGQAAAHYDEAARLDPKYAAWR